MRAAVSAGSSDDRQPGFAAEGRTRAQPAATIIVATSAGAAASAVAAKTGPTIRPQRSAVAKEAGASRLMLTVSLASDPVRTVELFGENVLPKLRD